jgi:hypothetical protein
MEKKRLIVMELELVSDHMRLLASALEKRSQLQEMDRDAFAQVLRDLADRLERLGQTHGNCTNPDCPQQEADTGALPQ